MSEQSPRMLPRMYTPQRLDVETGAKSQPLPKPKARRRAAPGAGRGNAAAAAAAPASAGVVSTGCKRCLLIHVHAHQPACATTLCSRMLVCTKSWTRLCGAAAIARASAGGRGRQSVPQPAAPRAAAAQPRAAVPPPAARVSAPAPARGVRQRWEPAPPRRVLRHITLDDRWAASRGGCLHGLWCSPGGAPPAPVRPLPSAAAAPPPLCRRCAVTVTRRRR